MVKTKIKKLKIKTLYRNNLVGKGLLCVTQVWVHHQGKSEQEIKIGTWKKGLKQNRGRGCLAPWILHTVLEKNDTVINSAEQLIWSTVVIVHEWHSLFYITIPKSICIYICRERWERDRESELWGDTEEAANGELSFEIPQSKHFKESRCLPWSTASLACYQQTGRNPRLSLDGAHAVVKRKGLGVNEEMLLKASICSSSEDWRSLAVFFPARTLCWRPGKGTLSALLNAKWMKEKQETSLNAANSFNSLWIYPYSNQSSNNGIMILIT